MSPKSDLQLRWNILNETIRVAGSLRQTVEKNMASPICDPPRKPDPSIPDFSLPVPHEILADISSLRIPSHLRDSILQILHSRIMQGQQEYIASYHRTCSVSSRLRTCFSQDFGAILQMYQALYAKNYLPMLRHLVSSILAKVEKQQKGLNHEVRKPFNHEYTPFLEKYFELNAYPSASHQSILAEKSMMTKRQIEVWFQNHRNRAKKDDISLRRNASDLPLRVALNVLQQSLLRQSRRSPSLSVTELTSDIDEEEDVPQPTSCIDAFESFRPLHAYPASYPPQGPDPFPTCDGAVRFPPPAWARVPASSASVCVRVEASSIDMDEFARVFHVKLNILEGSKKQGPAKTSQAHSPWFSATVTIPSPAPHPAFIRSTPRSSSAMFLSPSSSFSSESLMCPRTTPFSTNSFVSLPRQAETSRKILPLPRRIPVLSTSPNRWNSRTPSLSSESSSCRTASSSSSRSRTPEPTTPPQLPILNTPAIRDGDYMQPHFNELDSSTFSVDNSDLFTTSFENSSPQSINLSGNKQLSAYSFAFSSPMSYATPTCFQGQS